MTPPRPPVLSPDADADPSVNPGCRVHPLLRVRVRNVRCCGLGIGLCRHGVATRAHNAWCATITRLRTSLLTQSSTIDRPPTHPSSHLPIPLAGHSPAPTHPLTHLASRPADVHACMHEQPLERNTTMQERNKNKVSADVERDGMGWEVGGSADLPDGVPRMRAPQIAAHGKC